MFGAPFRSLRRPVLLIVVFGFFLMIVGLTALSQAIVVSTQSSQTMLSAIVGSDAATVRGFVNGYLLPADLEPGGLSAARAATLQAQLRTIDSAGEILRIEVRPPDGTVLLSDTADPAGLRGESTPDFTAAADGTVTAGLHPVADAESVGAVLPANDVLRAYFPVKFDEKVVAVVGIWRDAAPILGDLDQLRRQVMIVTLFAGALAAVALYLVFRAAQRRILRQTDELLEATRLDPLTGTLNHGALVGVLAVAIEAARHAEETLGVALLDIDNFRNLNQTYGHPAGDEALDRGRRPAPRRASGGDPVGALRTRRVPGHRHARRDDRPRADRSNSSGCSSSTSACNSRRPSACRSRSVPGSAPSRSTASR